MLTRVRLSKAWGPFKAGTVIEVDVVRAQWLAKHHFGREVEDEARAVKALDHPPAHKMVTRAPKRKGGIRGK